MDISVSWLRILQSLQGARSAYQIMRAGQVITRALATTPRILMQYSFAILLAASTVVIPAQSHILFQICFARLTFVALVNTFYMALCMSIWIRDYAF